MKSIPSDLMSLYIEAFCGLVEPFPMLKAYWANPYYAAENREHYEKLMAEYKVYWDNKSKAILEFYRAWERKTPGV